MKAPDFAYARPSSLDEALGLLASAGMDVLPLAGGQSLMAMLNLRLAQPDLLVDLNGLAELSGIAEDGDTIRIGALTRHHMVETSDLVARHLPLIAAVMDDIAHPAVRHRGTFGGSLALADPAAELPACCIAYGATIVAHHARGERRIAAEDFFKGAFTTALEPGELITAIEIPKHGGAHHAYGFAELARRKGDYAMSGLTVSVRGSGKVTTARLVLFGVADRPVRAGGAEKALEGAALPLASDIIERAAADAPDGIEFSGDLHASDKLKAHYAGLLTRRVLAGLKAGGSHG